MMKRRLKNENKEGEPWSALLLYCIIMTLYYNDGLCRECKLKRKVLYADKEVRADLQKNSSIY